jgi:hypothetical protein
VDDLTLIQLFAQMDAHTARHEAILAHHSTMLVRMDEHTTMIAQLLSQF